VLTPPPRRIVVLAGTNYGVRQARGKFGLGSKMALIWSKMSTGLPVTIKSAQVLLLPLLLPPLLLLLLVLLVLLLLAAVVSPVLVLVLLTLAPLPQVGKKTISLCELDIDIKVHLWIPAVRDSSSNPCCSSLSKSPNRATSRALSSTRSSRARAAGTARRSR